MLSIHGHLVLVKHPQTSRRQSWTIHCPINVETLPEDWASDVIWGFCQASRLAQTTLFKLQRQVTDHRQLSPHPRAWGETINHSHTISEEDRERCVFGKMLYQSSPRDYSYSLPGRLLGALPSPVPPPIRRRPHDSSTLSLVFWCIWTSAPPAE